MNSDMSSWDLLWYYEARNTEHEKLEEWENLWRKLLYNIELPFSHSKQLLKLLKNIWVAEYDESIFVYHVNGWEKPIFDGIRLWLFESLKEHHRNREKVGRIINMALTDDWIYRIINTKFSINGIRDKVKKIISRTAEDIK